MKTLLTLGNWSSLLLSAAEMQDTANAVCFLISLAALVFAIAFWIRCENEDREYYKSEADRYRELWLRSIGDEEDE